MVMVSTAMNNHMAVSSSPGNTSIFHQPSWRRSIITYVRFDPVPRSIVFCRLRKWFNSRRAFLKYFNVEQIPYIEVSAAILILFQTDTLIRKNVKEWIWMNGTKWKYILKYIHFETLRTYFNFAGHHSSDITCHNIGSELDKIIALDYVEISINHCCAGRYTKCISMG